MAPPKKNVSNEGDECSPNVTVSMSQTQLLELITALNESNKLSTQEFMKKVQIPSSQAGTSGNFANCTSRFKGEADDIDAFIDSITTYKECANVSNDNALRGLPMLLEGVAATWWQGVKKTIGSWDEAIQILKDTYSKTMPPHLIFRDIFAQEQQVGESTELYICKFRALISKLPYELPLEGQLDMLYGLLNRKIRKRLPRSMLRSFEELLSQIRDIEQSIKEIESSSRDIGESSACSVKYNEQKGKKPMQRCHYCHKIGHLKENCRNLMKKEKDGEEKLDTTKVKSEPSAVKPVCYGCGTPGVIRSKCTTCQNKNRETEQKSVGFNQIVLENSTNSLKGLTSSVNSARPLLSIQIANIDGVGYADSGAHNSIAGVSLYRLLRQKNYPFTEERIFVSYADGIRREKDVLKVDVDVKIKHKIIPTKFTIFPELENNRTLLGVDFLEKAKIVLNVFDNVWYFCEKPSEHFSFFNEVIPGNHMEIYRISEYSLRLEEGEVLNANQRSEVNQMLEKFSDVFAPGGEPTNFAEHKINTENKQPIASIPYPLSNFKKEFLKNEIDKLLAENIIEECESPWASPVVLIPKHNNPNDLRLCVDYRKLNSITVSDSFPMPRIEDLLHTAKHTSFMSTIDLQSGYWQVPVAPEDRDKTCFVTTFGTFKFNRMPFGLKNAPATFNRLMGRFCRGLGDRTVFAYLDDLLILSDSYESHISDLSAVFERLRLFKLRARREKCSFICNSILYLGHVITRNGIKPNPEKTDAIKNLREPTCIKHVQSFVQTCLWYRKFVPNFADIARPLTNLLKKKAKFKFEEEERNAFETLKQKLISPPILIQADQTKPYILRTDASQYAIGAALCQGEGNMERPVEYLSRLLTSSEQNFSTTEREALAIVWSTEKWRAYLENAEVTIASDHQPLRWLFMAKTPSGRIARWALKLQGLNMKVVYTPGKVNVVADLLSRPFCPHPDEESCEICFVSVELPRYSPSDLRERQLADADIAKIINSLESEDALEICRWSERGYQLYEGVLYRFNPEADADNPMLIVPESLREDILKQYHDSDTAGHYGIDHTYQKITEKFYWTGMRKYIAKHIKNCLECQRYKCSTLKPAGLLQTPAPAQRFEILAVDLFGPLPETPLLNKWILIVEDTASKWVEIFALSNATADACAKCLIEEVFLRFGTPRKLVSDNGVQFISDVMQKVTHCFGIKSAFIPLFHPESNPVERKNRELKTQLAILVQNQHNTWDTHISAIRYIYAINSTVCESTGQTPGFLTFGRQIRAPQDATYDLRQIVEAENFVPRITPYLTKLANVLHESNEILIKKQDERKEVKDKATRNIFYSVGDKVLITTHILSSAQKGITQKFAPKKDGPYVISKVITPTSYELSSIVDSKVIGRYHVSDITPFNSEEQDPIPEPAVPVRKRGRPRKNQ